MIETGVCPILGVVAGLALFPVTTFVVVVRCVAAEAGSGWTRECSILVTVQANGLAVFAEQRVLGSTVIELGFKPLGRLMARAALGTHDFLVGLIFKMTVDTLGRRFPMLQIWRMAIRTLCIGM